MEIIERLKAPTPKFWKKVQRLMLVAGTIAGAVLVLPVSLPAIIVTGAGYVLTGATIGATLAQLTEDKGLKLEALTLEQLIELRDSTAKQYMSNENKALLLKIGRAISKVSSR